MRDAQRIQHLIDHMLLTEGETATRKFVRQLLGALSGQPTLAYQLAQRQEQRAERDKRSQVV